MLNLSLYSVVALFICLGCVLSIYTNWKARRKSRSRLKRLLAFLPWFAIGTSIPIMSIDIGPEFSVVIVLLVGGMGAWACIILELYEQKGWQKKRSKSNYDGEIKVTKTTHQKSKNAWIKVNAFIMSGPIAGISSVLISLALTDISTLSDANKFSLSAFIFPFIWAAFAVWTCADTRWWRPTILTIASGIAALMVIKL